MKLDLTEIKVVLQVDLFKSNNALIAKEIRNEAHKEIYNNWRKAAAQELHSTRNIYIQGLSVDEDGVLLEGELANALEVGIKRFDMKVGFALSPKRKITASGGWKLVVPINVVKQNTKQGQPNGMKLPDTVIPVSMNREGVYKPKKISSLPTSSSPNNGKSIAFRIVSDKSDPSCWIHKGTREYNLGDKALQMTNFDEIIDDVINRLI